MDDEIQSLVSSVPKQVEEDRQRERETLKLRAKRIAYARRVAALAVEIVNKEDYDPVQFMETVIDSYHNQIRQEEGDDEH